MDFLKLAEERYSVREYADKKVEEEKINKILRAAQVAPTAKNIQPQKIYVLKSDEAIKKIREVTRCAFNAPVVFLICADSEISWKSPFEPDYNSGEMDASIAATHMMLEAWELGLGSVWVRWFDTNKTAEVFNLPENIKPICLLPVGYASENAKPSKMHTERKTIEDMVTVL